MTTVVLIQDGMATELTITTDDVAEALTAMGFNDHIADTQDGYVYTVPNHDDSVSAANVLTKGKARELLESYHEAFKMSENEFKKKWKVATLRKWTRYVCHMRLMGYSYETILKEKADIMAGFDVKVPYGKEAEDVVEGEAMGQEREDLVDFPVEDSPYDSNEPHDVNDTITLQINNGKVIAVNALGVVVSYVDVSEVQRHIDDLTMHLHDLACENGVKTIAQDFHKQQTVEDETVVKTLAQNKQPQPNYTQDDNLVYRCSCGSPMSMSNITYSRAIRELYPSKYQHEEYAFCVHCQRALLTLKRHLTPQDIKDGVHKTLSHVPVGFHSDTKRPYRL